MRYVMSLFFDTYAPLFRWKWTKNKFRSRKPGRRVYKSFPMKSSTRSTGDFQQGNLAENHRSLNPLFEVTPKRPHITHYTHKIK